MSRSSPSHLALCPIVLSDAKWIEDRWKWLHKTFGVNSVHQSQVVLPTDHFFPDDFAGDMQSAERMLFRIADYMRASTTNLRLTVFEDSKPNEAYVRGATTAAGLYWSEEGCPRIAVDASKLSDPSALAAVLAHELGHVRLLGEGLIAEDTEDHEPLTDLLTVWLGLGVITANAVLQEQSSSTALTYQWRAEKRGYLSMQMYGYALACFADSRNEHRPAWLRHLRPDVRQAFLDASAYRSAAGENAGLEPPPNEAEKESLTIEKPKQVLFLNQVAADEVDENEDPDAGPDDSFMTTETFLAALKSGRKSFRHLTMQQLELAGEDLSGCDFSNSDLSESNFANARLSGAILRNCDLADTVMQSADLQHSDLRLASFRRADLAGAKLQGADVRNTDFRACNLSSANFLSCRFNRTTNLVGAITHECHVDPAFRYKVLGEPGAVAKAIVSEGPVLVRPFLAVVIVMFGIISIAETNRPALSRVTIGIGVLLLAFFLIRRRSK